MSFFQKAKQRIKKLSSRILKEIRTIASSAPRTTWILFFSLIILSIFGFIIQQIKYRWADDPFQKIILAPLGEEPIKLAYTFLMFLAFTIPAVLFFNIYNKKSKKNINFSNFFHYTFVYIAVFNGLYFGYSEFIHQGGINSPSLHFSLTTIAAILFVVTHDALKDSNKKWAILTIFVSMYFHSIANQYTNLTSVDYNNSYLVTLAKFLQNNTFIKDQTIYSNILLLIALAFLLTYMIKYLFVPLFYKATNINADSVEKINLEYWLKSYSNVIILFIFLFISAFFIVTGIWYDLTINIAAGLICALITVYLFTYLFERKGKIIWRAVETEVRDDLKTELSGLLIDIMLPLERFGDGYAINLPDGENEQEVFRRHRLEQFRNLVNAEEIEFSEGYKKFLIEGKFGTLFISRKKNLNEFEYKYSKHLEPKIILSLIKLQRYLRRIDTAINIRVKKKLPLESEEAFFNKLAMFFHKELKELYILYELDMVEIY